MKNNIIFKSFLALLLVFGLSACSSSGTEQPVKSSSSIVIGDYPMMYYDKTTEDYVLYLALVDENSNFVQKNLDLQIELVNGAGEQLYNQTLTLKDEDFVSFETDDENYADNPHSIYTKNIQLNIDGADFIKESDLNGTLSITLPDTEPFIYSIGCSTSRPQDPNFVYYHTATDYDHFQLRLDDDLTELLKFTTLDDIDHIIINGSHVEPGQYVQIPLRVHSIVNAWGSVEQTDYGIFNAPYFKFEATPNGSNDYYYLECKVFDDSTGVEIEELFGDYNALSISRNLLIWDLGNPEYKPGGSYSIRFVHSDSFY